MAKVELSEGAIPLWQAAGDLAVKRMAAPEAISHLNQGLELVATLPRSSQRDASELGLRILLGPAWLALKGWPAPEVWTSLHPALALAKSLKRHDALASIYWGLIRFPEKLEGCSHTGAGLPMSQGYEQRLRMRPISWTSEFQAEQHLPMISLTVR